MWVELVVNVGGVFVFLFVRLRIIIFDFISLLVRISCDNLVCEVFFKIVKYFINVRVYNNVVVVFDYFFFFNY